MNFDLPDDDIVTHAIHLLFFFHSAYLPFFLFLFLLSLLSVSSHHSSCFRAEIMLIALLFLILLETLLCCMICFYVSRFWHKWAFVIFMSLHIHFFILLSIGFAFFVVVFIYFENIYGSFLFIINILMFAFLMLGNKNDVLIIIFCIFHDNIPFGRTILC